MLTKVAGYTNAIEAHLARLRLEEEGVPAHIFNEHFIGAQWDISQALGGVGIYVLAQQVEQARNILAAHDRGAYSLADNESPVCPKCTGTEISRRRKRWKWSLMMVYFLTIPLYFRYATLQCDRCGSEWDLTETRPYSFLVIFLAAALIAIPIIALVLAAMCQPHYFPSIFPETNGCYR